MKRIGLTIMSALAMLSVASVGSASAATEVGNNCTANQASANLTLLQLAKGSGSPPITVPEAGVVTKWKVSVIPFEGGIPTTLRVFRATGGANEFRTVAESAVGNVVSGSNSFDTRISVEAGDRFGSFGGGLGTLFCATENPADKMGLFEGNAAVGQTHTYTEVPGNQVAISATVEPDADKDGYGDETQDKCPQSAAVQDACPIISLSSYGLALKNAALILATSSYPAPVAVSATVNVPQQLLRNKKRGKRKGKRGARSSALMRIDGGVQAIAPGGLAFYTLKFPRALRKALRNMPRKRKLTLVATTSTTDVAGRPSSTVTQVKLPGQKKPNRGKRKGKGKRR